ncbi:MAG: hypothetical protein JXR96_16240 [Deltaproteobacteria bacterium]|nr:hypothetical protein [Deltaproteobacteria bacterium]
MKNGHLFIDQGGAIVKEYRKNLCAKGQPGPGAAFFRWLLDHEWRDVLGSQGVSVYFICPEEIEAKYEAKLGS